jgi:hypothetical protein
MTTTTIGDGKVIEFVDGEYDMFFDGDYIGSRRTRVQAEQALDEHAYQIISRGNRRPAELAPVVQVDDEVTPPIQMSVVFDALVAAYDDAAEKTVTDAKWHNAVTSAFDHLLPLDSLDYHGGVLMVQSASSDDVYTASPTSCQCPAFQCGNPCWHRAAARLVQIAVDGK